MKGLVKIVDELVKDWKRKPTVFLVDDDPGVLEVCANVLDKLDCTVTTAKDGDEAVSIFALRSADMSRASDRPFDLVFLDLRMPNTDGAEVLAKIREISPDQPVVIMTGYAHAFDWNRLATLGYVGVITKPFLMQSLNAVLKAHNLKHAATDGFEES